MKILITSDWYIPAVNGVVTSVLTLQKELSRRGHDVRILTLSGDGRDHQSGSVYALGSLDAGRIYPGARLLAPSPRTVIQQLIDWRPDVVHSQCEFSTFAPARRIARACGAPLVHTYHTVYEDYTHYFSPSRRWGRLLVKGFTRAVLARTDAVIAPSLKVSNLLQSYGVRTPVRVIPTGIDTERFDRPLPGEEIAARRRALGIPEGNCVAISLGRLAREKNIDELLDCRAALGDAPVTLLLVGGGPDQARLEQRARCLGLPAGAVVFTGMVSPARVPDYYRLGDVFVSASSSETQGLTYFEAMTCGLPLLCRDDPCLEGVVLPGENGVLWRTGDEFCAALKALAADPARLAAMGAASARHSRRFTARNFALSAEALYREACLARGAQARPFPALPVPLPAGLLRR